MKTEAKKRKFHTAEFKTKVRHPDPETRGQVSTLFG